MIKHRTALFVQLRIATISGVVFFLYSLFKHQLDQPIRKNSFKSGITYPNILLFYCFWYN